MTTDKSYPSFLDVGVQSWVHPFNSFSSDCFHPISSYYSYSLCAYLERLYEDCSEHDGVYCVAVVETAVSMTVFIVW